MERRMFVQIERRDPDTVRISTHDRMANVPEWIQISLKPTAQPFWTLPDGHSCAISEGRFGLPHELLTTARAFVAGSIDHATAERTFADQLAGWSRTTRSADEAGDLTRRWPH